MSCIAETVFSELASVCPIYCSGVASALVDGGNLHVAYYQETIMGDGMKDRVIVQRLVIPIRAVMDARQLVDFEIASARHRGISCIWGCKVR